MNSSIQIIKCFAKILVWVLRSRIRASGCAHRLLPPGLITRWVAQQNLLVQSFETLLPDSSSWDWLGFADKYLYEIRLGNRKTPVVYPLPHHGNTSFPKNNSQKERVKTYHPRPLFEIIKFQDNIVIYTTYIVKLMNSSLSFYFLGLGLAIGVVIAVGLLMCLQLRWIIITHL